MKKTIWHIALIVLVVVGVLAILDYFVLLEGVKRPVNNTLNNIKPIATECRKDIHCKMAPVDCSPCQDLGAAVNKDYNRFCPFNYKEHEAICSGRERQWQQFNAVCKQGECVAVYPQTQ